jgi:hypothetical protein
MLGNHCFCDIAGLDLALFGVLNLHFDVILLAGVFINELSILMEPTTKSLAHAFKVFNRQCSSGPVFVHKSMEGCFKRKAVHYSKLFEKHDSSCSELGLLNLEFTGEKAEHLSSFVKQFREDPHLKVLFIMEGEVRSIHENTLLPTVTMDVHEGLDGLRLLGLSLNISD